MCERQDQSKIRTLQVIHMTRTVSWSVDPDGSPVSLLGWLTSLCVVAQKPSVPSLHAIGHSPKEEWDLLPVVMCTKEDNIRAENKVCVRLCVLMCVCVRIIKNRVWGNKVWVCSCVFTYVCVFKNMMCVCLRLCVCACAQIKIYLSINPFIYLTTYLSRTEVFVGGWSASTFSD